MAIYTNKIYATRYPLLDFFFKLWKLQIVIILMSPSVESMAYNYLALIAHWGDKQLFNLRLYDTERRIQDRLQPLMTHEPYDIKRLREIKKIATEEIKRLTKLKSTERKGKA